MRAKVAALNCAGLSGCFASTNNQCHQSFQPTGLSMHTVVSKYHSILQAYLCATHITFVPRRAVVCYYITAFLWLPFICQHDGFCLNIAHFEPCREDRAWVTGLSRNPFVFSYFSYIHLRCSGDAGSPPAPWSEISFSLMLTCVCVRISVCLPMLKNYSHTKPAHTYNIYTKPVQIQVDYSC